MDKKILWDILRNDNEKLDYISSHIIDNINEIKNLIFRTRNKAYTLISVVFPTIIAISGFVFYNIDYIKYQTANNFKLYIVVFLSVLVILLFVSIIQLVIKVINSFQISVTALNPSQIFRDGLYEDSLIDMKLTYLNNLCEISEDTTEILYKIAQSTDQLYIFTIISPVISLVLTMLLWLIFTLNLII